MKKIVKNIKPNQSILLNHQWLKVLKISFDDTSEIPIAIILGVGELNGLKQEKKLKSTELVEVK